MNPSTVLIFRKRLLPYSETFIAEQGRFLPHWRPLFAGVTREADGLPMIQRLVDDPAHSAEISLLTEQALWPGLAAGLLKRLGRMPRRWLAHLQGFAPRVVHAHFGPDGLAARPIARALGLPLLTTIHGADICIHTPHNTYRRRRAELFRDANAIIAISDFIAGKLEDAGCPKEKIIRHNIGIDTSAFIPGPPADQRRGVLFIGRLVEKKGCTDLIAALGQLRGQHPEHPLEIIGEGPQSTELHARAQSLGRPVHWHGVQSPDQVRAHLARAAVLCVPSVTAANGDAEGLGMVFLEAQAMHTPVVSTRHGGIPEAVVHGMGGLLVDERSPAQLAQALDTLLGDSPRRQSMGESGRDHVCTHYDIRQQCAALEHIYETVGAESTRTSSRSS